MRSTLFAVLGIAVVFSTADAQAQTQTNTQSNPPTATLSNTGQETKKEAPPKKESKKSKKKKDAAPTDDSAAPDKILYDRAIVDAKKGRHEVARLNLQTLINTYPDSEYLAKAKLAIADAWFREGGSHGLAQAEAEYKDFILFYPAMEEAAEAQEKVCDIHYKQMEKPDRDPMHALRAEQECKLLIQQFPNSKFAPVAQQKLRDVQEVLADSEFRVGVLYQKKGSVASAANRYQALVDQFPLYSKADEALWQLADTYHRMGDNFEGQQVQAYQRIVKDYPLSAHAEDARAQLEVMKRAVPEADPVAMARMKFEMENHSKPGPVSHFWGLFRSRPDMSQAAKSGAPPMEGFRPLIPASVPPAAANPSGTLGSNEVSITNPGNDSAIDKGKEARSGVGGAEAAPAATPEAPAPAAAPAPAEASKPTAPEEPKKTTMSASEQKKEYQRALKQQQDAIKKAKDDRKKKEAANAAAVKEQKKKARARQDEKPETKEPEKPQTPQTPPPGGAAPAGKQ